jgi:hypothetical protein
MVALADWVTNSSPMSNWKNFPVWRGWRQWDERLLGNTLRNVSPIGSSRFRRMDTGDATSTSWGRFSNQWDKRSIWVSPIGTKFIDGDWIILRYTLLLIGIVEFSVSWLALLFEEEFTPIEKFLDLTRNLYWNYQWLNLPWFASFMSQGLSSVVCTISEASKYKHITYPMTVGDALTAVWVGWLFAIPAILPMLRICGTKRGENHMPEVFRRLNSWFSNVPSFALLKIQLTMEDSGKTEPNEDLDREIGRLRDLMERTPRITTRQEELQTIPVQGDSGRKFVLRGVQDFWPNFVR